MRSVRLSRIVGSTALVLGCLTAAPAWGDTAEAEALFQQGLASMKEKDYAKAAARFEASNASDPSPGTQINLALAYEKQQKWASAWAWYRSAMGLAGQRGQSQREENAKAAADRIKPMIHYVVISVKEPVQELLVKRDGSKVTTNVGGEDVPLPIDPGGHTIEVSAAGKKPWSKAITIADTPATERIDVPKLEDAPVEAKPVAAGGADFQAPVIVTNDGSGQRTVGILVGGAGVLAGLASVGLFILAKSEESKRDDATKKLQTPGLDEAARKDAVSSHDSHQNAANNDQLISIILAGGAVVMVGVGAVLYFTAPKRPAKAAKTQVLPVVGPSFAGIGLGGSF